MSFAKKKKNQPADLFLECGLLRAGRPQKKDQPADLFLEWLVRLSWPESQGSASEQVGVIVAIGRLIEAPPYNQTQTFGARDFKLCSDRTSSLFSTLLR